MHVLHDAAVLKGMHELMRYDDITAGQHRLHDLRAEWQ